MELSSPEDEHSSPLHQLSTHASELRLSLSPPHQSKHDERTTIRKNSLIKTKNRFKSVQKKIKDWLKRPFDYFRVHHG
jgi:hypothetical protein